MTYAEMLQQDRRLCILRLLRGQNGTLNESVIEASLHQLGHTAGVDRKEVRELLDFIEAAGLIKSDYVMGNVRVAKLTARGCAVAEGRLVIEGVKQPAFD